MVVRIYRKLLKMGIIINTDSIYKDDNIIMHNDVALYETSVADIVAQKGGNILEIGFGLGISATQIQTHNPSKHVIVEIEKDIYDKAVEWADGKSNVEVIHADWKDAIGNLTDKFDGVYNDADSDTTERLESFSSDVKNLCNNNCILVQTSWGMDNDIARNKTNYTTISLDENTKKWYQEDTIDIIYITLINNQWV